MSTNALTRNIEMWHWYPETLVRDLTADQLRWQPEQHDSTVVYALWHAYRAGDELIHGLVMRRPSVFATEGWASRLPVEQTGATPFGNGLSREQIAAIDLSIDEVCAYAKAVGASIVSYMQSISDDDAAVEVALPFFSKVYPGYDRMSRLETIGVFAIGHVCEHLGEVQFLRGLMGLKGAPL
jgi:hypothetical protein